MLEASASPVPPLTLVRIRTADLLHYFIVTDSACGMVTELPPLTKSTIIKKQQMTKYMTFSNPT